MILGYINGHRIYENIIRGKEVLTRDQVTSITFVPDIRRALFTPLKKDFCSIIARMPYYFLRSIGPQINLI